MKKRKKRFRNNLAFRSIFVVVLMLILVFGILGSFGYYGFTSALLEQYAAAAFNTADVAATQIDSDQIDAYIASNGTSRDYKEVLDILDMLCNTTESTFIYVIQPSDDYRHITFLFSSINRDMDYEMYDYGYVRETTNDDYAGKYEKLMTGVSGRELVLRNQGLIETDPHITAMIPLLTSDGNVKAILCVQKQLEKLQNDRMRYLSIVILLLIVLALLLGTGEGIFLYRILLKPIRLITDETIRFAVNGALPEKKLEDEIRNQDEIGILAGSVDRMEEQIIDYVEEQTRKSAEEERVRTELGMARSIQASQLPAAAGSQNEKKEFDIAASMSPAREVGGDFYDFFMIDEDHIALVIADVSGKGIPAALFMMLSKMLIKMSLQDGLSPADTLYKVNEKLLADNSADMFVTVWIAVLDLSSGRGTAANAGHEHPVLRKAGGRYELHVYRHSPVLGVIEGMRFTEHEFVMDPGDSLLVYTDGVTETSTKENELFGTGRLVKVLNEEPDASPEKILRNVHEGLQSFAAGAEQFDDITMLAFRFNGKTQGDRNGGSDERT